MTDFSAEFDFAVGELGLLPSVFWDLTMAELNIMADGYFKRLNRDRKQRGEELVYLAWQTAAFSRQEKLMPWAKIQKMLDDDTQKEQSVDDMVAMARALNTMFGGEEVVI